MALDYDELFQDLGKLIKHYNAQGADGTALTADLQEILDEFQDNSQDAAVDGLPNTFTGWKNQYVGRRGNLADFARRRLADRESVLEEIGATSADMNEVLTRLIAQMTTDSESVNASSVAIGSVTADAGNTGNGTVIVTTKLDGITSPGQLSGVAFPAHRLYANLSSELCSPDDVMKMECVQDSYYDRLTEGSELFLWSGGPATGKHGIDSEGAAGVGSVVAIHGANLLQNLDFETFTVANTPDNWTIDAGTAGTHIFEDNTGGNFYHATSALKYTGNGSQASMQVSQAITSQIRAGKAYVVTLRYKASSTIAAGQFTAQFEGTGYTAGSGERIQIAAGSLATSWTLQSFVAVMPDNMPSDMKLVLKWTGTPTNAKSLWIDDVGVCAVNYAAGHGAIVVRGSTPFVRGDKFTYTVQNTEGVIQKFFRRAFGYQLPSNASASETQADSVAT